MDDIELLLPEIDITDLTDVSLDRIRLQGTLEQRLPSIPGLSIENSIWQTVLLKLQPMQQQLDLSYDDLRRLNVIMRAKSRAEERLAAKNRRRPW